MIRRRSLAAFAGASLVVHVPYRGAAPALNDLHAGQVNGMFTSTASAAPMVAAGKLRPLAVTTVNRSPLLPDVPTMAEAGWPAAEVVVWAGVSDPILFLPRQSHMARIPTSRATPPLTPGSVALSVTAPPLTAGPK